jgi:hypothetical protein
MKMGKLLKHSMVIRRDECKRERIKFLQRRGLMDKTAVQHNLVAALTGMYAMIR